MPKNTSGGGRDNAATRGAGAGLSAERTANVRRGFARVFNNTREGRGNLANTASRAETIVPGITAEARRRGIIGPRGRITGATIRRNNWLSGQLIGSQRNTAANRRRATQALLANPVTRASINRQASRITGRGARARQFNLGFRLGSGRGNVARSANAASRRGLQAGFNRITGRGRRRARG
jgi:hypothetical protein